MLLLMFKEPDIVNTSLWNPARPSYHHQEKIFQHAHKRNVTQRCPSPCMHTGTRFTPLAGGYCWTIPLTPHICLCVNFHVLDPFGDELKGSGFKSDGDIKAVTHVNYF
jgi:hypothetical protein